MSGASEASKNEAYFRCAGLRAYYGESYVVQDIGFEMAQGEILALLGRNGAGKTSTLRALARMAEPHLHGGSIYLGGESLHDKPSWQVARMGLGLVLEDRSIIGGLTVEENLQLAQIAPPVGWSLEKIYTLFPRLKERRRQNAITLSGGEQQMLAIARILARDVKLLLLDEPYEGLAPIIVQEIEKTLMEVKALGITTIIVEQNAIAALRLSDKAIIVDSGEVVYEGRAQEIMQDTELRHKYLAI